MEAGGGSEFFCQFCRAFLGVENFTHVTQEFTPPKCLYISKIDQVWVCFGEVSVGFIYVEMVVFLKGWGGKFCTAARFFLFSDEFHQLGGMNW